MTSTPSSNVSAAAKSSNQQIRRYYQETAEDYKELMERVSCLEGTVSAMEGELAVVQNLNTLLSCQLDDADSYSRRLCMIVMGLWKPENDETNEDDALHITSAVAKEARIDKNDFMKQLNKIHPIGGAKNRNQVRIIKFATHRFEEKVFLQHKHNKKIDNRKKKKNRKHKPKVQLNVQPFLSYNRIDLLRKVNEAIEGCENFKFAYDDMHGNLKFILNKPFK